MTQEKLETLTKGDLIHLLIGLIGEEELTDLWNKNRREQKRHGIKCLECDIIANKLANA